MNRSWLMLFAAVSASAVVAVLAVTFIFPPNYNYEEVVAAEQEAIPETAQVKTITIGTIDDEPGGEILEHQPTADYIASQLSTEEVKYKGKVVIASSEEEMVSLIKKGELDLFFDSTFISVLVDDQSDATPFLTRWKEGVAEYHSVFAVRKDSPIQSVADFDGKLIGFEDPASSSGYLFPKSYLVQKGFDVHTADSPQSSNNSPDVSYVFTGEDENTLFWLVEGKIDIGTMSNIDFFEQAPENILEDLRVVERTYDIPRQLVSYGPHVDPVTVEQIRAILLGMQHTPRGIEILTGFEETAGYSDIRDRDETIAKVRHMLEGIE